ncbi:protein sorting system archaetidylserine decarboxylase [Halapricum hydrolyticum]|uniref:Protein sorting system archaetidylserine decarboxylase n=1 Tax=Halapricum hydrolyticum TaxID=2979991 RepID=A0AAE3IER0_9EURY|nr:protein sorting system archaetidylserine decarboxylase [Halapricum hydrolyticum]MCU4719639.1 protein sorting system archaetidylserine decarboxylase [Halapricum hydrolyticum]MCU4728561.1 protein sorting system archaetidylserine decarboxylase [Halapricum hydrolyticum]
MSRWFAPGTWWYAFPLLVAAGPVMWVWPSVGAGVALAGIAVLFFHRDPDREIPEAGYVSPADGTVSVVREEDGRLRVGVFMNVYHVHVNRAPTPGTIQDTTHVPGAHRPAFSKESDRNERLHVDFPEYRVTLIAGAFARRIHPHVETGDAVERGERIGHISFGSRVDVLFPPSVTRSDLAVERGDSVRAGETVLANA